LCTAALDFFSVLFTTSLYGHIPNTCASNHRLPNLLHISWMHFPTKIFIWQ
jgi:hypothetical protein